MNVWVQCCGHGVPHGDQAPACLQQMLSDAFLRSLYQRGPAASGSLASPIHCLDAWGSFPTESSKPGASNPARIQEVRVWRVFHKLEELGFQVTQLSPHSYLSAPHPRTQLSLQSEFLPLKWSWVFDLLSGEDLSSEPAWGPGQAGR